MYIKKKEKKSSGKQKVSNEFLKKKNQEVLKLKQLGIPWVMQLKDSQKNVLNCSEKNQP